MDGTRCCIVELCPNLPVICNTVESGMRVQQRVTTEKDRYDFSSSRAVTSCHIPSMAKIVTIRGPGGLSLCMGWSGL